MRSLVSLTCGSPGRVAISAAGLVSTGFLALGHADVLLVAPFVTVVWGGRFMLAFLALAFLGAAVNPAVDAVVVKGAPESKEVDHGEA